jgi:hypothetical protein
MTERADALTRIERELAGLGAEHEPPVGWEARVAAAIADQRIEGGLAALGEDDEPAPGWQARVLAATAPRPKRRWWWFAIPAPVLAAASLVFVVRSSGAPALEVAITTERTNPVVRTRSGSDGTPRLRSTAPLGDTLHARASGGEAHRSIWIYRGETELVAACPGTANCRADGNAIVASVALDLPGSYNIVILTSSVSFGTPQGSYDRDVAAATRAGAKALEQVVEVN